MKTMNKILLSITSIWIMVLLGIYLFMQESQAYFLLWYCFGAGLAICLLGGLMILTLSIRNRYKLTGKRFSWQMAVAIVILLVPILVIWYTMTH